MKRYIILLIFIAYSPLILGSKTSSNQNELEQQLEEIVQWQHQNNSFHGNISILHNGNPIFEKSFGFAQVEHQVPHTMKSKFLIASLSKQFTAAAILILQEQGLLCVTDPVSKYIPLAPKNNPPPYWSEITIHQLLTHTSGLIRDLKNDIHVDRTAYHSLDEILSQAFTKGELTQQAPGTIFSYSNFAYMILAKIIEKVSRQNYGDFLQRQIFRPLNMRNSGEYHRRNVVMNQVDGYFVNEDSRLTKNCCDDATMFRGSHGLYSDIEDLKIWATELSGASKILSANSLSQMKTAHIHTGEFEHYGYGLYLDEKEGLERIWHDGHEWGYLSLLSIIPRLNLVIVILGNRHNFIWDSRAFYNKILNDNIPLLFLNQGVSNHH